MSEYEIEPIPGLPGNLPPGEHIVWQGSPDWRVLARTAFHVRLVTGYFALLSGWAAIGGSTGFLMTLLAAGAAIGLLHLLAWGSARTTIYTLTNRRIVMRIGIAVPKCINLPLTQIQSAGLALNADGHGDVPLALAGAPRLGFLALWPHARPWHVARPQPMLRALPEAEKIASMIARYCLAANPSGRLGEAEAHPAAAPAFAEAAAA